MMATTTTTIANTKERIVAIYYEMYLMRREFFVWFCFFSEFLFTYSAHLLSFFYSYFNKVNQEEFQLEKIVYLFYS